MTNVTEDYVKYLTGPSIFVNYYELNRTTKEFLIKSYSRSEFFTLVGRYCAMMKAQGIVKGSR